MNTKDKSWDELRSNNRKSRSKHNNVGPDKEKYGEKNKSLKDNKIESKKAEEEVC